MTKQVLADPIPQWTDGAGTILASGSIEFYEAGTTTLKTVYADEAGSAELSNPNTLNASGQVTNSSGAASPIFGDGRYKIILKNSAGVVQWTADGVTLLDPSTFGQSLLASASAAAGRTTLGLGTVATLDTGTGTNDVIKLDASAAPGPYLPAVNGTNLTHTLPRAYLAGLGLSNGSDAVNDITVAAGECRDSTNTVDIVLTTAITKQMDATWAVGNNAGGLDANDTRTNDTWYHVYLIYREDTGVVDVVFSDDAALTATTLGTATDPAYNYFRRIGSVLNETADIKDFTQTGDRVNWADPVLDVDTQTCTTTSTTDTLPSVPLGFRITARVNIRGKNNAAATFPQFMYVRSLDADDEAVDVDASASAPLATLDIHTQSEAVVVGPVDIDINTSQQLAYRAEATGGDPTIDIATLGYIDRRGRDD